MPDIHNLWPAQMGKLSLREVQAGDLGSDPGGPASLALKQGLWAQPRQQRTRELGKEEGQSSQIYNGCSRLKPAPQKGTGRRYQHSTALLVYTKSRTVTAAQSPAPVGGREASLSARVPEAGAVTGAQDQGPSWPKIGQRRRGAHACPWDCLK